ncbi:MAG: RsmB/NOP family class I SAM-dependent RNA methyltransferase [Candidatus Woesearchaeota archaeon]|nr:RsmB/NOP family class I SAM-dependent RNA methyltransferase [Candidatus Woesearchaeota archaeon]
MDREFFLNRYKEIGGDIRDVQPRDSIRVNTSKISIEALAERLSRKRVLFEKIQFCPNGLYYKSKFSLGSTPEYLMGYYYLQEAASMLPVLALSPSEKDLVLDMCAAPGSKTTQLSEVMGNRGEIIAVEKNLGRCKSLKNNLERMGCMNVTAINDDALNIKAGEIFDRILLDAPCSGNYAIERGWFDKREINGIQRNSVHQKMLVKKASSLLKKGGILVYSTCSLEPEEDEEVVEFALSLALKMEKIEIAVGEPAATAFNGRKFDGSIAMARRLWPHKTGTQGFFLARMRKI